MINLADKFEKQLLYVLTLASITEGNMNEDFDWNGTASINILTPTMPELTDYTRNGTSRYGTPSELQDTKQTITIAQEKSFTFSVDRGNNVQQNHAKKAGRLAKAEIEEKVTPFWDKYRIETWKTGAVQNTLDAEITKDNVLDMFDTARKNFVNALIPITKSNRPNLIAYLPTDVYTALLNNPLFIQNEKLGEKSLVAASTGVCRGFNVIEAPDEYFGTDGKTRGLFTYKKSVVGPMQLAELNMHKDAPGIGGDLFEGRYLGDAAVVTAYAAGVQHFKVA